MKLINIQKDSSDSLAGTNSLAGNDQCSEQSSPSVLGVGPDGPPAVVRLFLSPRTDYGKWGWDRTPYGAL